MTVAEVIAELSKLPGHLPVAVTLREGVPGVAGVRWEGRYVALDLDVRDQRNVRNTG